MNSQLQIIIELFCGHVRTIHFGIRVCSVKCEKLGSILYLERIIELLLGLPQRSKHSIYMENFREPSCGCSLNWKL